MNETFLFPLSVSRTSQWAPLNLLFITDGADDHAADTHAHVHDDDDA